MSVAAEKLYTLEELSDGGVPRVVDTVLVSVRQRGLR